MIAKCQICQTENQVPAYGDWECRDCGQKYEYEEGHRLVLSDKQVELLNEHNQSQTYLRPEVCKWLMELYEENEERKDEGIVKCITGQREEDEDHTLYASMVSGIHSHFLRKRKDDGEKRTEIRESEE